MSQDPKCRPGKAKCVFQAWKNASGKVSLQSQKYFNLMLLVEVIKRNTLQPRCHSIGFQPYAKLQHQAGTSRAVPKCIFPGLKNAFGSLLLTKSMKQLPSF